MSALIQETAMDTDLVQSKNESFFDDEYLDVRREIVYGLHVMNTNKCRLLRKLKRLESCCDDVKLADAIRTGVEITNKEYEHCEQVLQDARILTLQGRLKEARDCIDRLIKNETKFFELSLKNPYVLADTLL